MNNASTQVLSDDEIDVAIQTHVDPVATYRRLHEFAHAIERAVLAKRNADAIAPEAVQPIDMVLHCPACGMQHIDAPEPDQPWSSDPSTCYIGWPNPPHRSHLCHGCGHTWRPADVPTNGVAAVKTSGKADSPNVRHASPQAPDASASHPVATIHVDGSFCHVEWKVAAPNRCHLDVYSHPASPAYWQRLAFAAGFEWPVPGAHGVVTGTSAHAVDLLSQLLGVDVEITDTASPKSIADEQAALKLQAFEDSYAQLLSDLRAHEQAKYARAIELADGIVVSTAKAKS